MGEAHEEFGGPHGAYGVVEAGDLGEGVVLDFVSGECSFFPGDTDVPVDVFDTIDIDVEFGSFDGDIVVFEISDVDFAGGGPSFWREFGAGSAEGAEDGGFLVEAAVAEEFSRAFRPDEGHEHARVHFDLRLVFDAFGVDEGGAGGGAGFVREFDIAEVVEIAIDAKIDIEAFEDDAAAGDFVALEGADEEEGRSGASRIGFEVVFAFDVNFRGFVENDFAESGIVHEVAREAV